jgi:hypothetical protein
VIKRLVVINFVIKAPKFLSQTTQSNNEGCAIPRERGHSI